MCVKLLVTDISGQGHVDPVTYPSCYEVRDGINPDRLLILQH